MRASRKGNTSPGSLRTERHHSSASQVLMADEGARRKTTVLIIEDEDSVRNFLRDALQGAGFDTVEARNGYEGLNCYRSFPTDLVITDLVTPDASGRDVILELSWETPPAKILAITSPSRDPNFLSMARRLGASRTLPQPFKREQLLKVVKEVLQERRRYTRIPVAFPISFEGEATKGEGKVINISRGGCAVESDISLQSGTYLSARLFPFGEHPPLAVELAAVRWSKKSAFSLEFIRMDAAAQSALHQFLLSLGRAQET